MKRIVVLPYFGKFNDYFPLWIKSCGYNKSIDWLIVTDCDYSFDKYDNVKFLHTTLDQLKKDFESKLGYKISLKSPYKLCDFKPLYGHLFSEYTEGYDYCGYCDCDLIWGNIDAFLEEELFVKYDKVLRNGHLSFIRNIPAVNEIFKRFETHKVIFKSPAIYNYDEAISGFRPGFAWELLESGCSIYQNEALISDIKYDHFPFYTVAEPNVPCIFSYEYGKTYRIVRNEDRTIKKTETMYFHMQKRKMKVETDFSSERFLIFPNVITDYNEELIESDEFWQNVTTEKENYFDPSFDKKDIFKRDIIRFIYEPHKFKSLKHRFFSK